MLENGFNSLKNLVDSHSSFAVVAHKNPDGDTLGSSLSLYHFLKSQNKNVRIFCYNEPPECLRYLPGIENLEHEFKPLEFEIIVFLDSAAPHLTGFDKSHPQLFDDSMNNIVNIDHHFSSKPFGNLKIVDDTAPSTATIITKLFSHHQWKITPDIATCLFTGLMTDTGSFMHSNTDAETYRIASTLLSKGANLPRITKDIFQTKKVSTLKLWGKVFSNLTLDSSRGVVISGITKKDLEECEADYSELTGAIDYLNSVHDANFACLLAEQGEIVKGSLRTMQEEVDVAEIAGKVGGGGHKKAAGFGVDGKLEKYVGWRVVKDEKKEEEVVDMLEENVKTQISNVKAAA